MEARAAKRSRTWIYALVLALGFLGFDTWRQLADYERTLALGESGRPAPAADTGSGTGYVFGQRNHILQSTDGYHWVIQTQQMLDRGEWRTRFADYDNAPAGRQVHWSSPPHWWLAACAGLDHLVSGRPGAVAVEKAAACASPLLLAALIVVCTPWVASRFGSAAAALFAIGLVTLAPLKGEFGAGSFDHHGLLAFCALLSVLGLTAGESPRDASWGALAGAAGLWISAATQLPILAALGMGALFTSHGSASFWRRWGQVGAVASGVGYLIEYFPGHLGWRLEVNHPLHALAWWGGGELAARLREWRADPGSLRTARARSITGLAAAALLAPPVVALGFSRQTFSLADPMLWALHVDYIQEIGPLWQRFATQEAVSWIRPALVTIGLIPFLSLAVLAGVGWRREGEYGHAVRLALFPAMLALVMALKQERWLHLAAALSLGLLIVVVRQRVGQIRPWPKWAVLGLIVCFGAYPLDAALSLGAAGHGLSRAELRQFAVRDLAFWLRRRLGEAQATVLSGPTVSTELIYHGGFKGIGTLYWENSEGLRGLVDIYGARTPAEALARVQQRGITHLVVFTRGSFADEAARLARGLRATEPVPRPAFLADLLETGHGLPDWVRPLTYRLPAHESFRDEFVFVLEVVPQQSPAEAAVRRAQFLASHGNGADALTLLTEIARRNPRHLTALIALAQEQRSAGQRAAHHATMEQITPLLAEDPWLETGDRLLLALGWAADRRPDSARAELARAWREADAPALRRLPPEMLGLMLRLTAEWRLDGIERARLDFAQRLLAEDFPGNAGKIGR